jgi:NLPC/P60 domain-containing protein
MGNAVKDYALQFVGNPYVYGGTSLTNGTDCSGFVMSVYKNFGVSLPHSSAGDRSVGAAVDGLANAQPGDLVCYSGHVALYIGGGQIVHASTSRTGIIVSNANYRTPLSVRRVF